MYDNKLLIKYGYIHEGLKNDVRDIMAEKDADVNMQNVEEKEKLPFAKAEVVNLMKKNLDDDKMIRERVKVEMNKFLGEILKNVCKQLNDYPYTMIEYEMFKESVYPYTNIERINEEKERILLHLDAIKADCDALAMDVQKTLKLNDADKNDSFSDFSSSSEDENDE